MALYFLFSIAVIVGGYVMAKISEYVVAKMGDYLVAPIGDFLVASVGDQLGYLFSYSSNIEDFRKHVEHLKTERDRVQKLVDDAEMSGEDILPIVQTWLTRVNNITEEARNFFKDEVQANTRCFYGYCPNLKLRYQQSKEAKTKTTEVNELKRDGKFDRVSCPAAPPERRSPDAEDFDSRKLISKEIMEALQDDEINMIGVYGIGGVGKTTLVEAVRKQAKDGNLFDEVVMASVSQTLSIIKIQDEIADMLLGLQLNAKSEKGRAGELYKRLEKKKRILVVLDDIWEEVRLEDIGIPFGAKHKGCKIVLTSRRLDVCNQMHTQRNFSIEVLPEQEAWDLFCKTVGDSFDSPDLHALAVQVAKECAGLPIAIVTLATALRNRSLSDWRDTANQLSKSIPSKKVFATLELSYNYLESEEAKSFFLLCCLFPEGSDIDIGDVWKYGMGLGLFQNVETVDEARERAVRLANDLKSSCLFLDGYSEEWVEIHDVVRDVGISIASRDKHVFLVRTGPGWKELPREDTFKRYTAISLKSNDIHVLPDKLECPQLQILLLDFYHSSLQLSNNFFLRMENLKVLHMRDMCFQSLPLSLQYLKNLRTLCLYGCKKLKDLSIIGELVNLEILSFAGSDMEELPKEIGNLSHLRLLDLKQCEKLTRIPPNVIRGLSQLEGLYMADGFVKWEVERQGKERSNASLAELKDLRRLINLEIDVPNADLWPEDLLFENLSRFQVSIGGFNGAPSDDFLYSISVTGMILLGKRASTINESNTCSKSLRLKVDVSTPLKNGINVLWKASEDLRLMEMKGSKNVLYDLDTQQFQHLRRLHVKKCDDVEYIFNASDWVSHVTFPVLEKLDLHRLPHLKGIWHGQLPSGCFCNLRVVKVFGCKGLKNLFSHFIAKDLSKLVELDVRSCKIMEQILGNEKEEAAVGNMEFPHLRSLKLLRLPNLRNFCSKMKDDPNTDTEQPLFHKEVALPALEKLEIFYSGNFKEIWHPQFVAKSFSQLKSLHVASCKKVLNVIPFNLLPRLPGLERLFVTHCDSVEQIVEVGRLGAGEGHVTGMLSQLRQIVLGKLPKLERMWWWDYSHGTFGFQNLRNISIFKCNSLKNLFSPFIASSFVQLRELTIDSCEMMETIIAKEREGEENCIELIAFPRLSGLVLEDLPKLMVFYTGRYALNFPSLETLVIEGCAAMKTFSCRTPRPQIRETKDEALDESPEEANFYISTQPLFNNEVTFPSLQKLLIIGLDNLEDIWHLELPTESFCRLRGLRVYECHKLLNVVPSNLLKDLKNLEEVSVLNCDSVEIIFEIEGLAPGTFSRLSKLMLWKLPKLRDIWSTQDPMESLISLQSLSSLDVDECDTLRNIFSPSIAGDLLQLKKVEIRSCEMMEAIVVTEREGESNPIEIIVFPRLHTLTLQTLPNLSSFYTGPSTLELPSLKLLEILTCPRMKSFTSRYPQMNDEETEGKLEKGSSCIPIRPLFDERVAFTNLEIMRILDMENLQELFHSVLPDESFCQLKRLEVDGCHKLPRVAPSNLLPRLKNLNELFVEECNSMNEIFEVEGLGGEGHILLFQLENMELCNLPDLRIFCSENYSFELPLLKRLKFEGCPKMQTFFSGSISTPKLRRITVEDGEKRWEGSLNGTIEHLFQEKASEDLRLMEMKGLKNVLYELNSRQSQPLRHLYVKKCDEVEYIFNASDCVSPVTFPILKKLDLYRLPNLKGIWHGQLPSGCFCNLRVVKVYGCKGLKNLFSHSIANDLSKLVELDVRMCKIMEQIFGNEKEEAAVSNMEFPHLRSLKLLRLPNLRNFCSKMKEDPNTHTEQPLFHKEVALPALEKLEIFNGGNFKEIWHPQFVAKSFSQLKSLHVASCKKVLNVIPFNLLPRLQGLERLFVTHCDSVEQIVEVGRLGARKGHESGMLSQLEEIILGKLPKLERMWWWDYPHGTFGFQNLRGIKIFKCNSLKSLFSPSIASSLVQLEGLFIDSCEMMETIIAEEREGEENHIEFIVFPQLSNLTLKDLPKLMVFYTGRYTLNFPAMKTFSSRTPRPQIRETKDEALDESPKEGNLYISTQPLFNNEVTFPSLQSLGIWGLDNLEDIWHLELPTESFCRLRELTVRECHKLLNVVPSNLLKDLKNLEEVSVLNCDSVEIIFEIEGLAPGTFSRLSELELRKLPKLRDIWSTQDPMESLISLQSLSWLDVDECDTLRNIFSPSIAGDLLQLEKVEIRSCEMMEAIVVTEREGESNPIEIIVFPRLHTLKLQTLPNLSSFYTGPSTLELPSLKLLEILTCPRMKSFTSRYPQMNDEETEGKLEKGSSCIPIRPLFDERVAFTNLEIMRILDMENLQELFHSLLPDESFCQLKRLEVDGCHKLPRVAPSNLLPKLKNLNELFVKECNSMKEIFEVEGLGGEGHIWLFQLENMKLCNLPDLRIFCSDNYSFELPLLKRLKFEGCPKMQTFFSGSISTPKLRRITIEDGEKRWEGSLNGTIEHLFQEKVKNDISSQQKVEEEEEEEGKVNKSEVGVGIEREENGSAQAIRHEISELAEDKA